LWYQSGLCLEPADDATISQAWSPSGDHATGVILPPAGSGADGVQEQYIYAY
jgi:hypothetical protein